MAILIPKTGIQYIDWVGEVDFEFLQSNVSLPYASAFKRGLDGRYQWMLDRVEQLEIINGEKAWFRERYLSEIRYRDEQERVCYQWNVTQENGTEENTDWKLETEGGRIVADEVVNTERNHRVCFDRFQRFWIPLPFVKTDNMGDEQQLARLTPPRIYFEHIEGARYRFVLMVQTDEVEEVSHSLQYVPATLEATIQDILHGKRCLPWLDEYIDQRINGGDPELRAETRALYAARYALFVKGLANTFREKMKIEFAPQNAGVRDVDCFVDFGNSSTCVLVAERPDSNAMSEVFKNAQFLEVRDLSSPLKWYNKAFPSRVVFSEPKFTTNRNIPHEPFKWKSPMRIGFEALRIIEKDSMNLNLVNNRSHSSSPKRYLADLETANLPWRFAVSMAQDGVRNVSWIEALKYISPQGEYRNEFQEQQPYYSNSSLCRMAFLEIFCHLFTQVNSMRFREKHGGVYQKRVVRNVVVSCPTGMSSADQEKLRRYAEEALKIFFNNEESTIPKIVPSSRDAGLNPDRLEERTSWMYDEATTTQLMYVYSALQYECGGLTKSFNQLYGTNNRVRIASIDIGGGTSDLMVCDYLSEHLSGSTSITPTPVFYDSFQRAGDDFQKVLIEELVIKASIRSYGRQNDVVNIDDKILGFFNHNGNGGGAMNRAMRSAFIQQVGLPLSKWLMNSANQNELELRVSFEEVFFQEKPTRELLGYFRRQLGFGLEDVTFKFEKNSFDRLLHRFFQGQVSTLMAVVSNLNCDVLVLGGGTLRIQGLEKMFRSTQHLSQNRIINVNNWEPGPWHPFVNERGVIKDAKSSVALGSAIAFWASQRIMPEFHLNDDRLRTDVGASNGFLIDDRDGEGVPKIILDDESNSGILEVMQFPMVLKNSALKSPNYIASPHLKIDWDKRAIIGRNADNQIVLDNSQIQMANEKIARILNKAPLKVALLFNSDRNCLEIQEVTDVESNTVNRKYLKIYGTVLEGSQYWLDNGFDLLND